MRLFAIALSITAAAATGFAQTPPSSTDSSLQVRYASNLTAADAQIFITNTGANGAGMTTGTGANITGSMCVNVYAMAPDEQEVSCCSCPVTPDGLVSLSVNNDLLSNTLTPATPSSVVIKLYATQPVAGSCSGSAALSTATPAPGLAAWGTTGRGTVQPNVFDFSFGTVPNVITGIITFTAGCTTNCAATDVQITGIGTGSVLAAWPYATPSTAMPFDFTANAEATLSNSFSIINNVPTGGEYFAVTPTGIALILFIGNNSQLDGSGPISSGVATFVPTTVLSPTETPFIPATTSLGELNKLQSFCAFAIANGSGYGICNSCSIPQTDGLPANEH